MERRYHRCGYPVWVKSMHPAPARQPVFFDGNRERGELEITICPQCGEALAETTLAAAAIDPARWLESWMQAWPALRCQLEGLVLERAQRDPNFYAYHAETIITEFDRALQQITELTKGLAEHGMSNATTEG